MEPNNHSIKNDNRQEPIRKLGDKNKPVEDAFADQPNINTIPLPHSPKNSLTKRGPYGKKSREKLKDANKDASNEREVSHVKNPSNLFSIFAPDPTQPNSMIGQLSSPGLPNSQTTIKTRKGHPDVKVLMDGDGRTNYAMANPKRNRDYHHLFKEIPHNELLINDYGCALQKEILAHGRIYVSLNYICFYANIFGWVTNTMIPFSDITAIEKKMTAFVIPNAILITTKRTKYFFTSFLSRDVAYELFSKLWKDSNPSSFSSDSDYGSDYNNQNDTSQSSDSNGMNEKECMVTKPSKSSREDNGMHHKMTCDCLKNKQHFDNVVLDTKFQGSVEKIYNLLYTSGFVAELLTDLESNDDTNIGEWIENDGKLVRQTSYTKRLNEEFGPKTTRCCLKEEVLHRDFDKYVTIMTSMETPDLRSSNALTVKTRTCIMWAGSNQTRVIATCAVESKVAPPNGHTEKDSLKGQSDYYKAVETAVREYISRNPSKFDRENTSIPKPGEENDFNSVTKPKFKNKKRTKNSNEETTTTSNIITGYFQKIITTIPTLTNLVKGVELKVPNIETIVLIAFILTLIINVYVWIGLKDITLKIESVEQLSGKGGLGNGHILDEWLDELRRQQLFSIMDENLWDIDNEKLDKLISKRSKKFS